MNADLNPCTEFGRHLKELRRVRGLSQEELAHRAGLDRTYISSCEAGRRNVTLRTIVRLAEALDVQPDELVRPATSLAAESQGDYSPGP